ncbi:MAG: apolipoprotein N-acyltransferase [Hyphomicrobiales bacterium]|nr:apolipoprotein N-acyltransferase [Hyphomicrobiales bacterium]
MRIAALVTHARGWRRSALAIGAGSASALALAPVFAWPVLFITLPVLVLLIDGAASEPVRRRALWLAATVGWRFGFGYFLAGLYWIGEAFFVEPDKFLWAMPFAVAGVPAGLALFYAVASALAAAVWRPGGWRILTLATCFFAIEWTRGHVFTGFPWNTLGMGLAANEALLQSASLIGLYGLTALAVFIFASPAALIGATRWAKWTAPVAAALMLAGMWIWGVQRLDAAPPSAGGLSLRIVQGNIPQKEKWRPENRTWIFERYLRLSETRPGEAAPAMVVWPESSTPFLFAADDGILDPNAAEAIKAAIPTGGSLILGAERASTVTDAQGRRVVDKMYNSLLVLQDGAVIGARYDKTHLVPFGEYLPFPGFFRWLGLKHLTHHAVGFEAGTARPALTVAGVPPFSPLICYEAIFPGAVSPTEGDTAWLLNVTNDAWFGSSSGPHQHLEQARMRAVEEGKPLVRAANTGISAVIDAHGRTVASLPLNATGRLDAALPPDAVKTAFRKISAWPAEALILFMLAVFLAPLSVANSRKRDF